MKGPLLGVAVAAVTLAGAASAAGDDGSDRRLRATGADLNARTWVRLRDGGERSVWVDVASAEKLKRRRGRVRTVLVLWLQDPETHIAHVGTGVAYTISETTLHCREQTATSHNWHFGDDGRVMAETIPAREDVAADDLLFDVICAGADVRESVRKETAMGVVNYEAAGQTDGPAAPE